MTDVSHIQRGGESHAQTCEISLACFAKIALVVFSILAIIVGTYYMVHGSPSSSYRVIEVSSAALGAILIIGGAVGVTTAGVVHVWQKNKG